MRPLDRVPSIKVKLSIVIVAAVAISATVSTVGFRTGIPVWLRPVISASIALAVVYPISRGMTSPLREMAAVARETAAGRPSAPVTATSRDEVGQLARAFNEMRAELDEVDRQRRDLVANVSHELRTPISALQATLENLVDGIGEPDPDQLKVMLVQVERLSRMVAQLLDLSRLESGGSPLHPRPFALGDVLDQVRAEAALHHDGHRVVVTCDPDLVVVGDPERIHQVVANLVDNAVVHSSPAEPVEVVASVRGGRVTIEVIDTGPGIAVDQAERVFERFYRADRSRAVADGGSGLGLAIVRWIVDLHRGAVVVDTSVEQGCRIVVELPAGGPDLDETTKEEHP